jgi:hypothetical protein
MVDGLAQVFIGKVAQFRGTTAARVASDFGHGGVLSASDALAAGMADSLGSLEALLDGDALGAPMREVRDVPRMRVGATTKPLQIAGVDAGGTPPAGQAGATVEFDEEQLEEDTDNQQLNDSSSCVDPPGNGGDDDDDEDESEGTEQEPDDSSLPKGEGALPTPTEERQRIAAILTCEEAKGREELARMLALETDHNLEAAKKILAVAPAATKAPANALEVRMGQIQNPKIGVPGDAVEVDSVAAEVARVLAYVPKDRKRQHVQ